MHRSSACIFYHCIIIFWCEHNANALCNPRNVIISNPMNIKLKSCHRAWQQYRCLLPVYVRETVTELWKRWRRCSKNPLISCLLSIRRCSHSVVNCHKYCWLNPVTPPHVYDRSESHLAVLPVFPTEFGKNLWHWDRLIRCVNTPCSCTEISVSLMYCFILQTQSLKHMNTFHSP